MTRRRKLRFAVLLATIGLAACGAPSKPATVTAPATGSPPPANAAIPSAADLRQLYADKTWLWADGGGYFGPTGTFLAATGTGDKTNYAKGFWWTTDQGAVCFDAVWHTKDSAGDAVTCFDHRRAGQVWYQKKAPSGPWYVFKSDPPKPADESAKLKPGDQIEAQLQAARTTLGISEP
jgi:uncharacterized protein DUF995